MADVSEPTKPDGPTRKSKRKAASKAKESQSNGSIVENENKDENKETSKAESPSRSTSSPDPNCAICLSKLENKSFTDSCFHMFCFVCLLEWSKIKAECPLCKQPFKSIIHNVRSYDDYDQYHLERPENRFSYDAQNDRRFRYRTTMTRDQHMFGFRPQRYNQYTDPIASLLSTAPTTVTTRQHWRRQRQAATSDFRKRVYSDGMRVVGVRDSSGRSRNVTPEFFSSNPATTHRLVPWLNRELNALLYNHEEHVQFVLELIMDLIKRFAIQSEEFYQHVFPFIGRHTRHFMHEFETFAKSPFCIISYDQKAIYEQQSEFVSDSDSVHSNDGNDSDVMIVSPSSAPSEPHRRRRDPGAVRRHNPRTEITPVSLSLRDLLEEDDEPVTAHSGWESPIAGPSWHLTQDTGISSVNTGSLLQPGTSSQTSSRERKKKRKKDVKAETCNSGSGWHNSDSNWVDSESESGSDVVCVGYDKPWQERTPVIVSTDSEEEKIIEKVEKVKRRKDRMARKEEEEKKRRRRSRSRSRSLSQSRRARSRSSSRYDYRRSRTRSRSRSKSRYRHKSSASRSRRSRSSSASKRRQYRSPSPYSRSRQRKRNHSRSVAYEDAFGYSRRTAASPESNRRKRKRDRYRSSRYSDSSRSMSRSPSRHRRDRYRSYRESRSKRRSRSSSVEIMSSRHRHKKHKKHKRSRESGKDKDNEENVHYKIVKDKDSNKKSKGDPLLSITIKRDKSEDVPVVSSTVDTAHSEIEIPENIVIRTEPITPPRSSVAVTEPVSQDTEESQSNGPSQNTSKKAKDNSSNRKEDSDSSTDSVEVRRKKSFKKHPSGHKKSRRPLPRIPDPSASTVTSSTSSSQSTQRMPVLDAISQLFQGYNSHHLTSTEVDQESLIPGMMANFFDSRLSHLYGYPGPSLPILSDFLPRSTVPQVTSSDQPLVVSSSDDSDVVVESVKNGSGQTVSSTSSSRQGQGFQGLLYNIMDRIPVISDDINSLNNVEIEETIDVEELENISPRFMTQRAIPSGSSGAVMEVMDSDEELEVSESSKPAQQSDQAKSLECTGSLDNRMKENGDLCTKSPPTISGTRTCTNDSVSMDPVNSDSTEAVKGSVVHGHGSGDEDQVVDVETCDSAEPSTSADIKNSCKSGIIITSKGKSEKSSVTDDDSMDIDVTVLSACQEIGSSVQEMSNLSSEKKSPVEHGKQFHNSSEESMDIDVVGGIGNPGQGREERNCEEKEASAIATVTVHEEDAPKVTHKECVLNENESNHLKNDRSPDYADTKEMAENVQADSSVSVSAPTQAPSGITEGTIIVSSSSCAHNPQNDMTNQVTESVVDSSSKSKTLSDITDDQCSKSTSDVTDEQHLKSTSDGTVQSSDSEKVKDSACKAQVIEGVSEISSDEESFVEQDQPQGIADASDISSEEGSYEEHNQPAASRSVPEYSENQPQVIADTSSDEGEISSDMNVQADVVHGASDISSDDLSDTSRDSSSKGNTAVDIMSRSNTENLTHSDAHGGVSSMSNYSSSDSRRSIHMSREPPAATKSESRSSGELSDDTSSAEQVYDDISSSENFDSPASPGDSQIGDSHRPSPSSPDAVHTRDQESLSEGEIVSD